MVKLYAFIAAFLIFLVVSAYVYQFYINLGMPLSEKVSDWTDFSSYMGGLLGPLLSFLSFIMLLKSLDLQMQANQSLREEASRNALNEKFKIFETYFFSMLDAQRVNFENVKMKIGRRVFLGAELVNEVELKIQNMRASSANDNSITIYLESIDKNEKIYNSLRIFYNLTKIISDRLSDYDGFSKDFRKSQYTTLISFTEFSLLRLILMGIQFYDVPAAMKLRNNVELMEVLGEVKLEVDPY